MARIEDLTVTQGTDANFKIYITDSDGDAKDISAKFFSASMKKSYSDTTSIDFTTIINNANGGILTLSLTNEQTADLDYTTRYVYDVMMYESGNTAVENILIGKVFIKPSVTRIG